ncbi:DUF1822 family protein [Phormidium pseudopriestleyi FRX01]|uniref:DUF1822 family protein n=1 Tax=Phormidium pseudopriestleyi FRX01 TaxID=1759528 RepID=A0ABS3FV90_9CYAN|nr:DUF1822 family protein [Phormidium pseudopriestleyi]MBO0351048.1 DUF1822 family protein [Phormidium pseudopriestleyi FRX01]
MTNFTIPMLIGRTSRRLAKQFALEQPNRQKAEQVYFNTLAVCVVNDYLEWMGIATELSAAESWNAIARLGSDIADLPVRGLGRIECRPMRENEPNCHIPPEVWSDRIGYVVVQIQDSLKEATILGFINSIERQQFPLNQLQTIETLLTTLAELHLSGSSSNAIASSIPFVLFSQWLQGSFADSWQSFEAIFGTENLAYNFRNSPREGDGGVERAKLIDLEMQFDTQVVVLLVALTPEPDRIAVRVRLYPPDGETYLPPNLKLALLSPEGDVLQEVRSRRQDNYIQLPRFTGEPGERFSIQVALENATIVETFEI